MAELKAGRDRKTRFFDYYHRAIAEGLTEAGAYRWAITEDIYTADDQLLGPGEATADGMCYHPQFAIENTQPASLCGIQICGICGVLLDKTGGKGRCEERGIPWAPPTKIPTRSETARSVFALLAWGDGE